MKTGMEYPLVGLVLLIGLVLLWNTWSGMQVDISAAALNATITGQAAPVGATLAGEWIVKAIVGSVIGGAVSAFFAALVLWVRREWQKTQTPERGGRWQGGQNAYWGKQPRMPSEAEVMRMALLQNMVGGGQKPAAPLRIVNGGDDEPTIPF
jgi:hypothetical protein